MTQSVSDHGAAAEALQRTAGDSPADEIAARGTDGAAEDPQPPSQAAAATMATTGVRRGLMRGILSGGPGRGGRGPFALAGLDSRR
jgi:hypothetical protein